MDAEIPEEIRRLLAEAGLEGAAPLGAGASAQVFRVRDPKLGREVVAKILPPTEDSPWGPRLERELRALVDVRHPNLVELLDLRRGGRSPVLLFPFEEGESLAEVAARSESGLPWRDVARIGAEVAGALGALHERGILHRDLKPANIVLTPRGEARVIDLGLAGGAAFQEMLTATGSFLGTPSYTAPGPARGDEAVPADDVHSLGVVLYQLLTGRNPFVREGQLETLLAIRNFRPGPIGAEVRDLPPRLASLIDSMLEKEAANRPGAVEVVQVLGDLPGTEGVDGTTRTAPFGRPLPIAELSAPPPGRPRVPWGLAGLLLLGLAAPAWYLGTRDGPAELPPAGTGTVDVPEGPGDAEVLEALARRYPSRVQDQALVFETLPMLTNPLHDPLTWRRALRSERRLGRFYPDRVGPPPAREELDRLAALEERAKRNELPSLFGPFLSARKASRPRPLPAPVRELLAADLSDAELPGTLETSYSARCLELLGALLRERERLDQSFRSGELKVSTTYAVVISARQSPLLGVFRLHAQTEAGRRPLFAWLDESSTEYWTGLRCLALALRSGEQEAPLALLASLRAARPLDVFRWGRFALVPPRSWLGREPEHPEEWALWSLVHRSRAELLERVGMESGADAAEEGRARERALASLGRDPIGRAWRAALREVGARGGT